MAIENVWEQAADLTNRVFHVTSDLNLPRGNRWLKVLTVSLSKANERLDSVHTLLDKGYWDSAAILTRTLFELAVNIAYIDKDSKKRLPEYLKHGGIPLTIEDVQQLQQKLAQEQPPEVKELVPRWAWRQLKGMCRDLGPQWLKEYETFYPYGSVLAHAGSFTLTRNYLQLLEQKPPSDHDRTVVLVTALDFHLRVASVAARAFPKQIDFEVVKQMIVDCQKIGQSLKKQRTDV